jgi:hypothetical protein
MLKTTPSEVRSSAVAISPDKLTTTVPVIFLKSGFKLPFVAHHSSLHHADYYLYSEMRAHFALISLISSGIR